MFVAGDDLDAMSRRSRSSTRSAPSSACRPTSRPRCCGCTAPRPTRRPRRAGSTSATSMLAAQAPLLRVEQPGLRRRQGLRGVPASASRPTSRWATAASMHTARPSRSAPPSRSSRGSAGSSGASASRSWSSTSSTAGCPREGREEPAALRGAGPPRRARHGHADQPRDPGRAERRVTVARCDQVVSTTGEGAAPRLRSSRTAR